MQKKKEKKSENYHGLCLHRNNRKDRKRKEKHTSKRKRWETPLYGSSEKSHSQQNARNGWLEVFSEKVKESFLRRVKKKKTRNGEVLNQSPKQLETNGKPNSPTNENINPPTGTCHMATAHGTPPLLI